MEEIFNKATESAIYIRDRIKETPEVAIILGSGLGSLAHQIIDPIEIPYNEIPNFPTSSVVGHGNKLIYGTIYDKPVIAMQGRFHTYEGYTMQETAFPIKVFSLLGIPKLIVSNAAGAINKKFKVADLMLITDHIKFSGDSPLTGKNNEAFGTRFPDMSEAYSKNLITLTKNVAKDLKINLEEGVYAYMPGPQYETPAEIRMLERLGADAVGMSTVPEVISAVHSGIEVLGISCITNATGTDTKLSHTDVVSAAHDAEEKFKELILEVVRRI